MTDTSLVALHSILFEQIDRLNNPDMTDDDLKREIDRANAMEGIARSITENAKTIVKTVQTTRTQHADLGLLPKPSANPMADAYVDDSDGKRGSVHELDEWMD